MKKKILVALSGGVDSAVAALLLKQQGYSIEGAYIRTWMNEEMPLADCPAQKDIEDSRAVAAHLQIGYRIVNLVNEYRERVVQYLVEGYRRGFTPNPDTMCNREMKFGLFLEYARNAGFDGIATGHYVQKINCANGDQALLEGTDINKDQSYFLALLNQQQIKGAYFPIGTYTKPEIRAIAIEHKLPNAQKKDSQGICFLGNLNINQFLQHYIKDLPGDIVNSKGEVLGRHRGLHRYTIGQRRGIGVPSNTDNQFYVVTGMHIETNQLIVGFEHPETPGLYTQSMEISDIHFAGDPIIEPCQLLAKPRYRDPSQVIQFTPLAADRAQIKFEQPQRALASGQVLALYRGPQLLGGRLLQLIFSNKLDKQDPRCQSTHSFHGTLTGYGQS